MGSIISADTHGMIDINKIVKFFNEHEGEYTSEDYLIHEDTEVDDLFYCLYDDIVVL